MPKLIIILCSGVFLIALAAYSNIPFAYFVTSAMIGITAAIIAQRHITKLYASGACASLLSASAAQHMSLLWAWGSLALFITYSFFLPAWREWITFSASFALLAIISLFFSKVMASDAQKGKQDQSLHKLGRLLTIIQLSGTLAAVIGLLIDPQKTFLNMDKKEWAANNIFLFGALGLLIVSATGLYYLRNKDS